MENPLSFLLCPAPTHGSEPGWILQIPWETDAGTFKSVSQLLAGFAAGTHQNCSALAAASSRRRVGEGWDLLRDLCFPGHGALRNTKIHLKLLTRSPYLQVGD